MLLEIYFTCVEVFVPDYFFLPDYTVFMSVSHF